MSSSSSRHIYTLNIVFPEDEELKSMYEKSVKDNPTRLSRGDAGFDLYIPEDQVVPAGKWGYMIDLGIKCELLAIQSKMTGGAIRKIKFQNLSYDLRARSSICKTPLILANSIGTIDAGYRGSLKAAVHNFSNEDVVLKKGERYFQIVGPAFMRFEVELVKQLSFSERDEGGFGSTGK